MQQTRRPSGQWITVDGQAYEVTLASDQIRVHLPYAIDPQALSSLLQREGFPLAHDLDTPDTQGWGSDFSPDGYYPYWVYPDPTRPGQYVFAFNPHPEDVIQGGDQPILDLGERSMNVIQRWVPVLARMAGAPPGARRSPVPSEQMMADPEP